MTNTNLEITPPEPKPSKVMKYPFRPQRETTIRVVNEETFRYLTERPRSPASVLKIFDAQGREVLAIERGND